MKRILESVRIGPARRLPALFIAVAAHAAFTLSPDGTTVYDTVSNITWLANANLASTARFGLQLCGTAVGQPCVNASGSMNYQSAAAWVAAMNAANYLGHSNWQLPTTPLVDKTCPKTGPNGGSFGFGCTAGALDAMYNGLGLKPPSTAVPIPANTVGPFQNLQPYLYWSQSSAGPAQGNATFAFTTGWQGANTLPNLLYLLPMIPGKIAGAPASNGTSLQVSADGKTVYDPMTNITWLANANLAATNTFGLPRCTDPTTPALCVAQDGAMTWSSAMQLLTNMNSAAYLGQTNWQAPTVDPSCPGYNCDGAQNPMGNLFYDQLGFQKGMTAVAVPDITVGPFHNIQPYLYWTCAGATIQSPCQADGPAPNFEWSYSFGSGFQGTDLLANDLFVTAYFVGQAGAATGPAPVVTDGSVANGATYIGGGLVPGSWAQVKGTNLANVTHPLAPSDFNGNNLPLAMSGASVTVNGQPAALYYVSPTQIDFQVPSAVTGTASVEVFNNGVGSNVTTAPTVASAPGIWPIIVNGTNYAAAAFTNGHYTGDPAAWSGFQKAKPGDVLELFGTGLAASQSGVEINEFQPLSGVTVTLGTVTIAADGAGLVEPGEFQINFTVPLQFAGMPEGNYPVTVTVNGVSSPATINTAPVGPVVIPVQH